MFREVPVLPVVAPLGAACLAVMLWHLHRRELLTVARVSVAVAACVYAAGVVANTVFPIYLDKPGGPGRWTVQTTLLTDYELGDALMNVAVFVPIGVVGSLVLASAPWWRVMACATALSLLIEVAQLVSARFLAGGHVADVNDLLFNLAGAGLGLGLLWLATMWTPLAAVADRFRWR